MQTLHRQSTRTTFRTARRDHIVRSHPHRDTYILELLLVCALHHDQGKHQLKEMAVRHSTPARRRMFEVVSG